MKYYTKYDSPVGEITITSDGEAVTGVYMANQRFLPASYGESVRGLAIHDAARAWLDSYFGGGKPRPHDIALAPAGTEFRLAVWELLCRIPYGQTASYGDIAKEMAALRHVPRMSAQAVGGAVGHNPIGIIIPCHRVIGSDGGLVGYGGGLDRKVFLLRHEGVDLTGI